MTTLLRALPYLDRPETVMVGDEPVLLRPYQIIVWVSVSAKGISRLAPGVPRFPAILDTGNTFTFMITDDQLSRWAGLDRERLPVRGSVSLNELALECRAANVWLHRNRRDQRNEVVPVSYPLELERGIAIHPKQAPGPGPRLPLLGLRALDENGLVLRVNCTRRRISLTTAGWLSRMR
jgi:hypothetical protein